MADRIVVGMSGGVDSSVAAALLVEQGCDVVGVTMRVWPRQETEEPAKRFGSCCGTEAVEDARQVARTLGIPHYLLSMDEEFNQKVIGQFVDSYAKGQTPIPCLSCNSNLKFGSLLGRAHAWDAVAVATGHYARVERDRATGRHLLMRPKDLRKDQTDFLWPLTQAQLGAARFPIGELTKDEVRARARRLALVTADKPESQDICFVPDGDYRGFLRRAGANGEAGEITDTAGRILGRHAGVSGFTVGQRRGLGVAGRERSYVVSVEPRTRRVVVGRREEAASEVLITGPVNWVSRPCPPRAVDLEVQVRHRQVPIAARVEPLADGGAHVVLSRPVAVPPGQAAVFYDGDLVAGGAWITRVERSSRAVPAGHGATVSG
jgi:tRNA-uridine 2-sulfurtransferase